jgi:hypothetical protein
MQVHNIEQVVHKPQTLSQERVSEVEGFIDFLSQRDTDKQLSQAAMTVSESTLKKLWDNSDDAQYDQL